VGSAADPPAAPTQGAALPRADAADLDTDPEQHMAKFSG
jgi:hypothetical protein